METSPTALAAGGDREPTCPTAPPADSDEPPAHPYAGVEFWYSLIDEKAAAEFLNLTDRTMQKLRQQGGGPRYSELSARCIRYTRFDLRQWAESKVRTSTSDTGDAAGAEGAP